MINFKNLKPGQTIVHWFAFMWGLLVFLPVGVNYFCLLGMALAVLAKQDLKDRLERLKNSNYYWPLIIYVGWFLIVMWQQDIWYEKTPSNLFHAGRIILTIMLAFSLSNTEAMAALRGFALASVGVILLIIGVHLGVFPLIKFWDHLIIPQTNKTIGASILLSFFSVIMMAYVMSAQNKNKLITIAIILIAMGVVYYGLAKRTAMVGIVIGFLLVVLHLFRGNKKTWILAVTLFLISTVALWFFSPSVRNHFDVGIREIQEGLSGEVKVESWNMRIHMIVHTWNMMVERPIFGWGIGSWNEQWSARVTDSIRGLNMPHNDALWMGAQAGFIGALSWLFLMLGGVSKAWKSRNWMSAAATAIIVMATFSALVNNGTRDATLGLPMLWIMGVIISAAQNKNDAQ